MHPEAAGCMHLGGGVASEGTMTLMSSSLTNQAMVPLSHIYYCQAAYITQSVQNNISSIFALFEEYWPQD